MHKIESVSATTVRTIFLTNSSLAAIVSEEDYEDVMQYTWHPIVQKHTTYAKRSVWRSDRTVGTIYLHRYLTKASERTRVDHIDRNGLNCVRSNLQVVTASINGHRSTRKPNELGYKGVILRQNRYMARIGYASAILHLGTFDNPLDAALAYDTKAIELYGKNAETNF